VSVATIAVIVCIVVGAVYGAKANVYPDYYKIQYTLKDICMILTTLSMNTVLIAFR
jgi:hypothetical protein